LLLFFKKEALSLPTMTLSTHVLDIVRGAGAAGMRVDVTAPDGATVSAILDAGGRATLLDALSPGTYELAFYAGDYQAEKFYGIIPVRFAVTDPAQKYHIPLVLSAYGYSTYRGG
jgi:5-hydroxyisourate hydrolase